MKKTLATATQREDSAKTMTVADRERIIQLARDGNGLKNISNKTGFDISWIAAVIDVGIKDFKLKNELLKEIYGT